MAKYPHEDTIRHYIQQGEEDLAEAAISIARGHLASREAAKVNVEGGWMYGVLYEDAEEQLTIHLLMASGKRDVPCDHAVYDRPVLYAVQAGKAIVHYRNGHRTLGQGWPIFIHPGEPHCIEPFARDAKVLRILLRGGE